MTTTRRTFMQQFGVTLGALLASSCMRNAPQVATTKWPIPTPTPPVPMCYAPPAPPEPPTPDAAEEWNALRACWLDLQDGRVSSADGDAFSRDLLNRHAYTLSALRTAGQLDADVAGAMAVAFDEAIYHIRRPLMGTCYELTSEGVSSMGVRGDMTTQAAALAEMAERSTIDPATVARAQEALERDIAWLEQYKTGNQTGDPERIDASPAEVEAARVLVELLLERR